jgi:hypothetical protein
MSGDLVEGSILDNRTLNRALLARQMLLERSPTGISHAIEHLVGLQAQVPADPYFALGSRVEGFDPAELGAMLVDRSAVRMVVMRGTLHLVTARDALYLRAVVQPAITRTLYSQSPYGRRIAGVDVNELLIEGRRLLEERPLTLAELRPLLATTWPDVDAHALGYAVHYLLPLVQIPPRGVWGRSGRPTCTTAEAWLGAPLDDAPSLEALVLRYLGAFGPASPRDAAVWSGLSGLRVVFERLRSRLVTFRDERGVELFDLPQAPRPDAGAPAPVRFLGEYDNVYLSHVDRRRILRDEDRQRFPGAPWRQTMLVDGFGGGAWKLDNGRDRAVLSVRPIDSPGRALRDEIVEEGERLLAWAAPEAGSRTVHIEPVP